MRVLVAISILAFVALLWASVAIFRHIRRARRRRRRQLEASRNALSAALPERFVIAPLDSSPIVPEITFNDPAAPPAMVAFADAAASTIAPAHPIASDNKPYTRPPEPHRPVSVSTSIIGDSLEPTAAVPDDFIDTLPPPPPPPAPPRDPTLSPLPPWPHFGFTPSRPSPSLAVAQPDHEDLYVSPPPPLPPLEPVPYAAPSESSASIVPARLPMLIQPPGPAVKPIYQAPLLPQQESGPLPITQRPSLPPMRRADLAYFNKDMGDLSDPTPAGSRTRIPAFVPETQIKPKSD